MPTLEDLANPDWQRGYNEAVLQSLYTISAVLDRTEVDDLKLTAEEIAEIELDKFFFNFTGNGLHCGRKVE